MAIKDQHARRTTRAQPADGGTPARRRLDAAASTVAFGVRKMGLYTVKGRFRATDGEMTLDGQGRPASGAVTLDASSVSTRMPPRDLHLRSAQFLAVKQHPAIKLQADDISVQPDGTLRVRATASIKGVTRQVELQGHWHPGAEQETLHITGRLDRHEFGIRPPIPFEWVVGRHVDVSAQLAFVSEGT